MFSCASRAIRGLKSYYAPSLSRILASGYKSDLSLDKLYPSSNQDFLRQHARTSSSDGQDDTFTGYIPTDKLEFQYSRSGGPGGQHVNKVNTKVEVRFNIDEADWIPEFAKPKLKEQQTGKITKDGFLIITSEKTRKQILNQADCLDKLRHMVFQACVKPKELTEEEKQTIQKRIAKAKAATLKQKRARSLLKQSRAPTTL